MKYKYPTLLFLCCTGFLFIYNPSGLYFLSDDFDSILYIQKGGSVIHSFRPFTDLTIKVNYLFWHYNPIAYFLTNILLHFLSTFVLYVFSKQLFSFVYEVSEIKKYSFFTAVFFLFYPYHSEPLFWIVGRGAILSTLMALLSLHYYIKRKKHTGNYVLALFFFTTGAFAYEIIWILPVVVAVISLSGTEKSQWRKELLYILGFGITLFFFLLFRYYLINHMISSPYGVYSVSISDIPRIIRNFGTLICRSFIPPVKNSFVFLFSGLALVFLLLFIFYKLRRRWNVLFTISISSFLICMLPVISFGINTHTTESERFLYLPSVFLSLLIILVLATLMKKRFPLIFITVIIAEIFLLYYNYQSFETSSKVTRQTVKAFSFLKKTDHLYCISLPSQYKGAFIFRNGIQSAITLFADVKNVSVLSKVEMEKSSYSYDILTFKLEDAIKKGLIDSIKADKNIVVFSWEDNRLKIYK